MTDIQRLAREEHQAEQSRTQAEAAWRTSWWRLTEALGQIEDRRARGIAQEEVSDITGQSSSYVSARSRTGRWFAGFDCSTLPPRMSQIVVGKIEVTADLIARIKQAEADGVTLREFQQQVTGKAWSDTAAGASADRIEQIAAAQPEAIVAAITKDPALADAIVASQTADRALNEAFGRTEMARRNERSMAQQRNRHDAVEAHNPRPLDPMEGLTAVWAVDHLIERATEVPRTESSVAVMRLAGEALARSASYLIALANGEHLAPAGAEFDAELRALLEAGDRP